MPELPEVESLRRSLEPHIVGQVIHSVEVLKPKLVSSSGTKRQENQGKKQEFERELKDQRFSAIQRVAKNLLFTFDSGKVMMVHLKMTGQLVYQENHHNLALGGHPIELSERMLPNKHTHIIFALDRGMMYYNDVRMFGYALYYPNISALQSQHSLSNFGMDPMSDQFVLSEFQSFLGLRKSRLKSVLLAQDIVVGLGNIYVDEACFQAGIQPHRMTNSLTSLEVEKLFYVIRDIIERAVAQGGSSVANYIMADGSRGTFAREHKVYGRSGKFCLVCQSPLSTQKIQSRTTVSCPTCQT